MDQITNWMQSNWYELASLFAQFAFLFAGLWFAGKILRTMRATQQQMGALVRLSMTDGLEERSKINETAHETIPSALASPMLGPATERATSYAAFEKPARTETPSLSSELSGRAKPSMPLASAPLTSAAMTGAPVTSIEDSTPYVAAPLTPPEDEPSGEHLAAAGRGGVQWLQTPMAEKRSGGSPLRKVVRWLQAPVRS